MGGCQKGLTFSCGIKQILLTVGIKLRKNIIQKKDRIVSRSILNQVDLGKRQPQHQTPPLTA